MAIQTWSWLDERGDVRCLKYSWGPATANALAVKLEANRWMIVGCPIAPSRDVLAELEDDGEIAVLLAPNAYHYLGQRDWRRRHPKAKSYAPAGAHARLSSKSPDIPYGATTELAEMLPPSVAVIVPDGQKSPDALVRITSGAETVWWLGDLFSNTTAGDAVWWLRLVSRLAGSGVGYRCNTRPELVYVSDRARWLRSVGAALEAHPPNVVVPAHGDPVIEDVASRTRQLVTSALQARH